MAIKKERKSFSIVETIKEYFALKFDYIELLVVERVALVAGKLALSLIYAALYFLLFCFVLLLIYQVLILCVGIPWLVSLIEIALLLLVMGIVWVFREKLIITPITNSIVRAFANSGSKKKKNDEEDEDEDD